MSAWFVLYRRELAAYLVSLMGYLVLVTFLLVMGFNYFILLSFVNGRSEMEAQVYEIYFNWIIYWIVMILVPPMLTMRLFSEEKSTGTIETLLTAPVTEWQVVLAKFFGAFTFFALLWLPTLGFLVLTGTMSGLEKASLDYGLLASCFLGTFLIGSLLLAVGCFASVMTRSQLVAVLVSGAAALLFILGVAFLGWLARQKGNDWQAVVLYMSAYDHMESFTKGRVDLRAVVFYVSATAVFLWATKLVLEARKWR